MQREPLYADRCRPRGWVSLHSEMGRKRRKRKTTKHNRAPRALQWGFDYGCPPNVMAVGGLDFPTLLTEARVDAVAYDTQHSPELNEDVPAITLVAQDGDPLAKAFSIFHEWTTSSDSDAVELTFVLRDAGGYILGISPETSRLEQRCLGYDRTHQAISVSQLWCKQIDSTHPMLLSFRDHYASAHIAPYMLGGATYIGPRSAMPIARSVELHQVSGLRPLLKFEVTFVDECEIAPGTIGWLASHVQSSPNPQAPTRRDKPEPNDIATRRHRVLAQHFPVTLERMRISRKAQGIILELQREGIEPWQVEQALCNLILGVDLDKENVKTPQEMRERTNKALDERYERADGSTLPLFGIDQVRSQVLADGNELLAHVRAKRIDDLSSLQSRLRSRGLLDGRSVVVAKPRPKKEVTK